MHSWNIVRSEYSRWIPVIDWSSWNTCT